MNLISSVADNIDGTKTITTTNRGVNSILNKYFIYSFERLLENKYNEHINKIFMVECNDINLMTTLQNSYPSIFVKTQQYQARQELYIPNDYAILPPVGTNIYETRHLDLIGAIDAWDITHGSNNVIIGINENGLYASQIELINKVVNPSSANNWHASGVAGIAAGDTDNNQGLSSIGFNCNLAEGSSFNTLISNNAKVINMSYGSGFIPYKNSTTGQMVNIPDEIFQNTINILSDQQGVVLVAAAGNGVGGNVNAVQLTNNGLAINSENYSSVRHFPASYKNVISVSTVGNWNQPNTTAIPFDNWINIHKITTPPNTHYNGTNPPVLVTEPEIFHQHNDSVDIVVPAYRLPVIGTWGTNTYWDSHDQGGWSGTSFSAPIVSGTIGLIFSVNYCLKPKEVESILKLTAGDIENIAENLPYYGRLGGGVLDAFRAVQMSNEMAKPFGTVRVNNRLLYRNWFYILETAPYEIKMENNLMNLEVKVKFLARDNIELLSGDYTPTIGYIDLQIDPNLSLDCVIPSSAKNRNPIGSKELIKNLEVKLYPNPSKGKFTVLLNKDNTKDLLATIFDVFGKLVYQTKVNESKFEINLSNFPSGMYLVKLSSNTVNEILKYIKE